MTRAELDSADFADHLWVVTSCMSRLRFLRVTAPLLLSHSSVRYCLVDYSCPEACGNWLTREFRGEITRGRCVVERVPDQVYFNKCKAHNAGARRAIREGARLLCFVDADTLVEPALFDWLSPRLVGGHFLIAALGPNGQDVHGLTGMLAVTAADFVSSGGFDESFCGWGSEDIEMRLRLHVLHGLTYLDIPLSFIRPIEHEDGLRALHYRDKDIYRSDQRNFARLVAKLHTWLREGHFDRSSARRLFYQPPRVRASATIEQG